MLFRSVALCCLFAVVAVMASTVVSSESDVSGSDYVDASFVESLATAQLGTEAMSNNMAAGVGEGSPCAHDSKAGTCTANACHGTSVSGLCAGSAAVRCCITPDAAPAPRLPVLGAQCKAFGAIGTCAESAGCKGRSYYGFCSGSASVKCCVPAVTRSQYSATTTTITASAAARLAEAEHQAKWQRFKARHNKRYSSTAVEAQRYAQFKRNRQTIVEKNDRLNRGVAVYKSTSPFADLDPVAFARLYFGVNPTAAARSLMEMSDQSDISAADRALFEQTGAETVVTEAESEAGVDEEANAFIEMEAELEAETESEVESESESEADPPIISGPVACSVTSTAGTQSGKCVDYTTCSGTVYSGKCAGAANIRCCIPKDGPVTPPTPSNNGNVLPKDKKVGGTLTIDYRNILTPFKNQQSCGSCWAFASTSTYETAGVRAGVFDKTAIFAPQQPTDCATQWAHGCGGAAPEAGFIFFKNTNATFESNYPYKAVAGTCKANAPANGPKLINYASATRICAPLPDAPCPNQQTLKASLEKYGPLLIAVDATNFQFYDGGIFPDKDCTGQINHAVQLVGYGTEVNAKTGVEEAFYLIRNSWGNNWGEGGFIRVQAFSSTAATAGCSILSSAFYAIF